MGSGSFKDAITFVKKYYFICFLYILIIVFRFLKLKSTQMYRPQKENSGYSLKMFGSETETPLMSREKVLFLVCRVIPTYLLSAILAVNCSFIVLFATTQNFLISLSLQSNDGLKFPTYVFLIQQNS